MTLILLALTLLFVLGLVAWTAHRFMRVTTIVMCPHNGCTCEHCGMDLECPTNR